MRPLSHHDHIVLNCIRLKCGLSINCTVNEIVTILMDHEDRLYLLDEEEAHLMVDLIAASKK